MTTSRCGGGRGVCACGRLVCGIRLAGTFESIWVLGFPGVQHQGCPVRLALQRSLETVLHGALGDLNYALETSPDDAVVLFHRCYCYRDLNRFPEALSDANRLVELAPTSYHRWLNRAEIYEKMKQPDQALADIQKALEVSAGTFDPFYAESEVFTLRGRVYLEGLADSPQAIADFTHALELNLFSGKQFSKQGVLLLRAVAYDLEGDAEKAKQDRAAAAGLKR